MILGKVRSETTLDTVHVSGDCKWDLLLHLGFGARLPKRRGMHGRSAADVMCVERGLNLKRPWMLAMT